jgi:hypothetical protein
VLPLRIVDHFARDAAAAAEAVRSCHSDRAEILYYSV